MIPGQLTVSSTYWFSNDLVISDIIMVVHGYLPTPWSVIISDIIMVVHGYLPTPYIIMVLHGYLPTPYIIMTVTMATC